MQASLNLGPQRLSKKEVPEILKKEFHNVVRRTPMAESEGFKPPIPGKGIPDFESSAFGHSANLPFPFADAKVAIFYNIKEKTREKTTTFNKFLGLHHVFRPLSTPFMRKVRNQMRDFGTEKGWPR